MNTSVTFRALRVEPVPGSIPNNCWTVNLFHYFLLLGGARLLLLLLLAATDINILTRNRCKALHYTYRVLT